MFTGIVETTLPILNALDHQAGRRLTIPDAWADTTIGESIALNGCCLTAANLAEGTITFDLIRETLGRTNLGGLAAGDVVNVERSLRVGGRIDGHFVQGHIDGIGRLVKKQADDNAWRYTIELPAELAKYLSPKGSICVDGVSLTIASVERNHFDIALIPTTLALTTLAGREVGWQFNIECDSIAKQIVTFLEGKL